MVSVASLWNKRDLIQRLGLPEEKVEIVPAAPVLTAYPSPTPEDLGPVRKKFNLPENFLFYPAQTWPHKNHIGVLEALAVLRDRYQIKAPFVSSGGQNNHFSKIEKRVQELRLNDQVHFLGFVEPLELRPSRPAVPAWA